MFLSFSFEWRSSVVQARMCKLGRDPLIFLKILVVIVHVCIYWSKVAEGFSVFNTVLFIKRIAFLWYMLYCAKGCYSVMIYHTFCIQWPHDWHRYMRFMNGKQYPPDVMEPKNGYKMTKIVFNGKSISLTHLSRFDNSAFHWCSKRINKNTNDGGHNDRGYRALLKWFRVSIDAQLWQ